MQTARLRNPIGSHFRIVSDKKIKSMKAASLLRPLASKTLPRPLHTSPALAQQAAPVQARQDLMFHSLAFPNFESFSWPKVYMSGQTCRTVSSASNRGRCRRLLKGSLTRWPDQTIWWSGSRIICEMSTRVVWCKLSTPDGSLVLLIVVSTWY